MPSDSLSGESSSQDRFYALDLNSDFAPLENSDNLIARNIAEEATAFPKAFKGIASVLDF